MEPIPGGLGPITKGMPNDADRDAMFVPLDGQYQSQLFQLPFKLWFIDRDWHGSRHSYDTSTTSLPHALRRSKGKPRKSLQKLADKRSQRGIILGMERTYLSLRVPKKIAVAMREAAGRYSSGREVWVPTTAAMIMFLEATPEEQRAAILRVRGLEIAENVDAALDEIRENQAYKTALAEAQRRPVPARAARRRKVGEQSG